MTLLTLAALALAALAGPVILMYILKLRRRPLVISSTFLWRRALDDVQANAPWQRLRPSVLLLLQLLALLALVLVLARPAYTRSERFNGDLILIVDESYGMLAHDVAPSRFAAALGEAHTLAAGLPSGNVTSVIGMASHPTLEIAESGDSGAVSRAIDGLHASVSTPNLLEALSLAASLARSGQATRAVVLTSRQSGISSLPIQVPFPVEIKRIGARLRDVGIVDFSASRGARNTQALARIGNFGVSTSQSELDLFVDGQLADVRPLALQSGKQQTLFWTDLPPHAHVLRAQLARADDVTADKQAWTVIQSGNERRVMLVSSGDYFLQAALSVDPTVRLSLVAPRAYSPALTSGYDLVVFDNTLPRALPPAPALLLSPPSGRVGPITFGKFTPAGSVLASSSVSSTTAASILLYVEVSDVHVARARTVSLPGWEQPIFTSNGVALLAAGENNGRRLVATTFDLQESDWPLRISFPILMQNLLRYLAPGLDISSTQITTGQPVKLSPAPGVTEVDITRPDHTVAHVFPPFPPFTDTALPGIYSVTEPGRRGAVSFAANSIPARPAPAAGPQDVVLGGSGTGSSRSVTVPVDVGWAVVLVALGVLTAEWWFAFRR
jgi:hypothetical protein